VRLCSGEGNEEEPETPRSVVDSDDDEENPNLDEETKQKRRRARAMAVSAEPIDPKTIKERLKLVPNIEKSVEETSRLLEVLLPASLFRCLKCSRSSTAQQSSQSLRQIRKG
jgi:hypothetical protein